MLYDGEPQYLYSESFICDGVVSQPDAAAAASATMAIALANTELRGTYMKCCILCQEACTTLTQSRSVSGCKCHGMSQVYSKAPVIATK